MKTKFILLSLLPFFLLISCEDMDLIPPNHSNHFIKEIRQNGITVEKFRHNEKNLLISDSGFSYQNKYFYNLNSQLIRKEYAMYLYYTTYSSTIMDENESEF